MNKTINHILPKLREARKAKGLSYQDIADDTDKIGESVSVSTVKRVFSKDADISTFRYNQTIRPIIRVVLGLDEATEEPTDDPKQAEEYYTTIEAMKAVIDFKHQQITEYVKEIEQLKETIQIQNEVHQKALDAAATEARLKIDHLKDQIAYLRTVNDHNARESAEKSQLIKSLLERK